LSSSWIKKKERKKERKTERKKEKKGLELTKCYIKQCDFLFIASNHQTVQHKTEGLKQTGNTYKIMSLKNHTRFKARLFETSRQQSAQLLFLMFIISVPKDTD